MNKNIVVPGKKIEWKVSYVDELGNVHENVVLRPDADYRIIRNGIPYICTILRVRTEDEKVYIIPKLRLCSGFMNVMIPEVDCRIDLDEVTDITEVEVTFGKALRSGTRVNDEAIDSFTFAFPSERYYPSTYKIAIAVGEYVAFGVRDPETGKSHSIYGSIVDVDTTESRVKIMRYMRARGVRSIREDVIDLNRLVGIYRYELSIYDIDAE